MRDVGIEGNERREGVGVGRKRLRSRMRENAVGFNVEGTINNFAVVAKGKMCVKPS